MSITGFESLDNMIMESSQKADELINFLSSYDNEALKDHFEELLAEGGFDWEEFLYDDIIKIKLALKKRGINLYAELI